MLRSVLALLSGWLLLSLPIDAAHAARTIVPAYAGLQPRGPQQAQGIVIYSHGRSLVAEDMDSPPPAYLELLGQAGWDAMRFNRPAREDSLQASAADLAMRVRALKAQGYRRVVLAGQSFGGFLSVMAAAQAPGLVDSVIATAPAAFGSYYDSHDTWQRNASELYRHLDAVRGTRVLLAFFHRDEYDPGGRADRARTILAGHSVPSLVIDQPRDLTGHLGAATPVFAKRFGACLRVFLETRIVPESGQCDGMQMPATTMHLAAG